MIEHSPSKRKVGGSSPSTTSLIYFLLSRYIKSEVFQNKKGGNLLTITINKYSTVFGDGENSQKKVPCGSGAFSLEEGRIAPLPLPRHVVRGDYLECLAM